MSYPEEQIRIEALVELAGERNGRLTTTELIRRLEARMRPTGRDAQIMNDRNDTHFSQKVRNLVSHRNQGDGLQVTGLASYDAAFEGWQINQSGRDLVNARRI